MLCAIFTEHVPERSKTELNLPSILSKISEIELKANQVLLLTCLDVLCNYLFLYVFLVLLDVYCTHLTLVYFALT